MRDLHPGEFCFLKEGETITIPDNPVAVKMSTRLHYHIVKHGSRVALLINGKQ
jgi:hypothetical protein